MKYVIGLIIGISLVFLLGNAGHSEKTGARVLNAGGTGTYQAQMSYDGKTIAVMDTRTGTIKIFNVRAGDKVLSFTDDERFLKDYRLVNE
jgi:hypothetical protein